MSGTNGRGPVTLVLVLLVRMYQQVLAPHMPAMCRFEPSCSRYAVEALDRHGAVKGLWLTARRLLRCRPGGPSGYDPVPDRAE